MDRLETILGTDKMESDLLAVSSKHAATESEVLDGQEKYPLSVNRHPHLTTSVSSSPTQCGESPSCYLSILPTPLPLYCNLTVSFSFLSLDFGVLEG